MEFSSLNPYQTLEQVTASSPEELVTLLKQIKTPIRIISIGSFGTRQVAYIVGDIRKEQVKKTKSK